MFKVDTTQTDFRGAHPIVYLEALATREALLSWQLLGLSETASGYGSRLTSSKMVQTEPGGKWRRVYVCQYSNAGTAYVRVRGECVCVRGV